MPPSIRQERFLFTLTPVIAPRAESGTTFDIDRILASLQNRRLVQSSSSLEVARAIRQEMYPYDQLELEDRMISERQAESILMHCEEALGHPLNGLRRRLANHSKPYSNIWELVTLYCVLPLGSVVHEPKKGSPDVCIRYGQESCLWIESTYVYSKSSQESDKAQDFTRWILDRLRTAHATFPHGVHISLEARDNSNPFGVPDQSTWGELIRDRSWSEFVETLRSTNPPVIQWVCPKGNATIEFQRTLHRGSISIGLPSIKEPASPDEHPVYKEIKHKAEQARKWDSTGESYHPLVLCLGASENPWEVDSPPSSGVSLQQAVYSALSDVRRMSLVQRINTTKRIDRKSLRVRGAKHISGVIVVTLKTHANPLQPGFYRVPRASLLINQEAARPLTHEEIHLLGRMRFDSIEWGPGWESWERERGTKRSDNTHVRRIKKQWGGVTMRDLGNGTYEIELSANVIALFLSGDITHEDLRTQYGEDLAKELKAAIKQGRQIVGCEYVNAEPMSRKHDCIRFTYGPPKPLTISDPRKEKASG